MYRRPGDMSVASQVVLIYETNNYSTQYLAALVKIYIISKEKHAIKLAIVRSGIGSNLIRTEVNFIINTTFHENIVFLATASF
jgi:hypothetical protein